MFGEQMQCPVHRISGGFTTSGNQCNKGVTYLLIGHRCPMLILCLEQNGKNIACIAVFCTSLIDHLVDVSICFALGSHALAIGSQRQIDLQIQQTFKDTDRVSQYSLCKFEFFTIPLATSMSTRTFMIMR